MADDYVQVRPGDIISSALINGILQQLADMQRRIDDLEGNVVPPSDPVAITGFDPPEEVAVGQPLAILGRGFNFPPVVAGVPTNTVRINDVQITAFQFPSSAERLTFTVPTSLAITAPTTVTVRVSNNLGEAQPRNYRLLPPIVSTVPPPLISQVSPLTRPDLTNVVILGQIAVIQGTNFAAQADDNVVRFVSSDGSNTYQGTDVTVQSPTELRVRVPLMLPEDVPPFGSHPVHLSVQVAGNPTPSTRTVLARRF